VKKSTTSAGGKSLFGGFEFQKYLPYKGGAVAEWWNKERKDKAVLKALPNRDLDCMAVEGELH